MVGRSEFCYSVGMSSERRRAVPLTQSLSARLFVLTLIFISISEVLIYVPSIARFRQGYLEARIASAQLASLVLVATPDQRVTEEPEQDLLTRAEIRAVVIKRAEARTLILGVAEPAPTEVDATFDLRGASPWTLIRDTFETLLIPGRTIRVVGAAIDQPDVVVDVVLDEAGLRRELFSYSGRVIGLTLVISAITGLLIFLSLHGLIARPLRRLVDRMVAFRQAPEEQSDETALTTRSDEIGIAQRELSAMQADLRTALKQRARLADLGLAVSKINHDLRNILATAQLVADRLEQSGDPEVRRTAPVLVSAIDRAIELCTRTLQFGKPEEPPPQRTAFDLRQLVADIANALGLTGERGPQWINEVPPGLLLSADRSQCFRILMNLGRNAIEALEGRRDGRIVITAAHLSQSVVIDIADNGPGMPEAARAHLFEPFRGSAKSSGSGLGLAIARDLARSHGGDLALYRSDAHGTTFRIDIPSNVHELRAVRAVRPVTPAS
ncbi:MAG: HAMP domain-containing histidine kinase [Alphaproteobacteria bacterium]|nr:HAMP domain-containing histidine kinase [Alphaproteobacteria bacterium]